MIGMGSEAGGRESAANTDADAIARSWGEPAAFAAIFDRHFESVYGFARRRVGEHLA